MIKGTYFDGISSNAIEGSVKIDDLMVIVENANEQEILKAPIESLKFLNAVGNIPCKIIFKDRQQFVTHETAKFQALTRSLNVSGFERSMRFLEQSKFTVLTCLLLIVSVLLFTTLVGIPKLSRYIAENVNSDVLIRSSEETLWALDRFFKPSELSEQRIHQLRRYFKEYDPLYVKEGYSVEFRKAKYANAFALPNGTIVFTDKLVNMSENDEELLAIYFHEQGHVYHRHGLINLVQSAMWSIVLAFMLTDFASVSDLVVNLPLTLSFAANSRELEIQADEYAYNKLIEHNISTERFSTIMEKLTQAFKEGAGKNEGSKKSVHHYFSTHPPSAERIERFRLKPLNSG